MPQALRTDDVWRLSGLWACCKSCRCPGRSCSGLLPRNSQRVIRQQVRTTCLQNCFFQWLFKLHKNLVYLWNEAFLVEDRRLWAVSACVIKVTKCQQLVDFYSPTSRRETPLVQRPSHPDTILDSSTGYRWPAAGGRRPSMLHAVRQSPMAFLPGVCRKLSMGLLFIVRG